MEDLMEQELEKQKLLFHQARLANRGVAEMVLLHVSAARGQPSEMVMTTLKLGIAILRGGNVDVQAAMLNYLKEKKDASFFLSISGLMSSCSVLDLDAFERNTKAEGLGVGADGCAGEKNMHDAEFTCALFRFIQLTCEGHNLDWQNYLRTQAGNTTTVNVINCTVDYLLRLQESIMDFYWHYSSKEIIDPSGKSNFFKAIGVASQVFNTLTEVIQGPCVGNQQTLAHSRLWDAVGGFLFLFAHMQDKLSKHSSQVDLLKELLNLQKDMVIMMLSMLEGNVVNGTIGKQMVDTLVESASNVELILKYFDMFLKLRDLTSSTTFQELDMNKDGTVTPKEFKEKMEQQKNYTTEEINFLLMCCDCNHDGKIDYVEFTERFHNPAKEIGFNLAVLLTNLSEHMPNDPRLARFLETAGSVLNYFEPFLGRIEIMGGSKRIERVYFEIKEENIDQWEKPQIKESKRGFFYAIVTEGDKEKLEAFVNFCEDAIFEMQHAAALMEEEEDALAKKTSADALKYLSEEDEEKTGMDLIKAKIVGFKDSISEACSILAPSNVKRKLKELKQMTVTELLMGFCRLLFMIMYHSVFGIFYLTRRIWTALMNLMQGPPAEQASTKQEKAGPLVPLAVPGLPEIEAKPGPPAIEMKPEGEQLSLEAKPEEHTEADKMKPVLEALAELKEDISPEEAIAAVKMAEKKSVEKQQEEAMQEAEVQPTVAEAEPPPVAQPLPPSRSSSFSPHSPPLTAFTDSSSHYSSPTRHSSFPSHRGLSEDSVTTPDTTSDASTSTGIFSSSTSPGNETTRVRKSITLPTFRSGAPGGVTHSASHQSSFTHSRTCHAQSSVMSSPQSYDITSPLSLSSKSMQFSPDPVICGRGAFSSLQPTPTRAPASISTRTRHTTSPPSIPASGFTSDLRPAASKSIPISLCHAAVTTSTIDASGGVTSSPIGVPCLRSPSQSVLGTTTSSHLPQLLQSLSSPAVSLLHEADISSHTTSITSTTISYVTTFITSSVQADSSRLTITPSSKSSSATLHQPSSSASSSPRILSPSHQAHIEQEEDIISISISATDTEQPAAASKSSSIFFPSHHPPSPNPALLHEHCLCPPSHDPHAFLHPGNVDLSQLTPTPPTPTQPHPSEGPPTRPPTPLPSPSPHSSQTKPWVLKRLLLSVKVDLSSYNKRAVSFLARNFYNLKYAALVLAFCINFILLFFQASAIAEEGEEEEEATVLNPFAFGSGDLLGSGDEAVLGDDAVEAELGSGNFTLGEDEEEEEEEDAEEWVHMDDRYFYLEHIIRLFSVTHSLVALCMLLAYYHLKIPLVIFKREKDVARRLEFDGIYVAEQPEDDDIKAHWDKLVISAKSFPNNYWDKFVKKKVRQKYSETYDFDAISNLLGMETTMSFKQEEASTGFVGFLSSVDWRYQIWKAGVTVTDNQFLYNLWYLTFSVLGNVNYFFFAAHLLDVAVSIPSLKTILQSVTHNGKQLILTCMLLTIIVYCYTVIAFNFFRKFYVSEEDDVVDQKCHDMMTCFVFHLYKGVRAGGGIGDEIEAPDGDEYEFYRIIFDITFFFFIIVILLAIIQGLIIDAFGELRDQLESVKENLESNCFICGIGSDYFDAVPHGFDMHVLKEHNLANYMFFLMHLINKDETEYTGQETYVWNMYQQRCWDFFPVGDCFRKQYEEELSGGGSAS